MRAGAAWLLLPLPLPHIQPTMQRQALPGTAALDLSAGTLLDFRSI